jgi:hypothetical protein
MIYRVRARFRPETAAAFLRKLTDGTVARQVPDGQEIVASMNRAVLNEAGEVEWSELCFCVPPLAHERATILDAHFEDITTEVIQAHRRYEGTPFMEHLKRMAELA